MNVATLDLRSVQDDIARRPPHDWPWLEASYAEPELFLDRLYGDHAARRKLSAQSKVGVRAALFSDLVHRHGVSNRPALAVFRHGVERETTYATLLRRVCQRAVFMAREGVEPGTVVCVVAPFSESLVIDLLALLKLGAVASILEPRGPTFVRNRLEALAPERVIAQASLARWWSTSPTLPALLADDGLAADATVDANGHTYAAGDEAMRLFSPLGAQPGVPVSVTADALLTGALRDALLVHRLDAGDRLGAPLFDFHQHQPAHVLSALFAGATYVHVPDDDLLSRPDLLPALRLRVAGLASAVLANEVHEHAVHRLDPARWFVSLAEPLDVARLQDDAKRLDAGGKPGVLTLTNAAFGGTFLFTPQPARVGALVTVPTPGQRYALVEANGSGMPAESIGAFLPDGGDEATVGRFVLGRARRDTYFGGSLALTRSGRVLPDAEIAAVAETERGVHAACLVLGTGALPNTSRAVLLVFTTAKQPDPLMKDALRARITAELGADFVPDRIELYPLVPRITDGRPDALWCASRYFSGRLDRRRGEPLFVELAAARRAVLAALARAEVS